LGAKRGIGSYDQYKCRVGSRSLPVKNGKGKRRSGGKKLITREEWGGVRGRSSFRKKRQERGRGRV